MNSLFHQDMIVQDVVRDHHCEMRVFHRLRIDPNDTCTLAEAALKRGLSIKFLMVVLDKTAARTGVIERTNHNFQAMLLEVIIEYIEEHHHVFLKNELPRLKQLFDKVSKAHCCRQGSMLGALKTVFLSFKANIEEHLAIEEEILFPRLRNIERYTSEKESPVEASGTPSPINALEEMKREHELMEWGLNEMRTLTCDYTTPDDASGALTMLYDGLIKIDADLQEHAHLENDLLWPVRLSKQPPIDPTIVTNKGVPSRGEGEYICPLTHLLCNEGSLAVCGRFWDCVSKAMHQRWIKINKKDSDD